MNSRTEVNKLLSMYQQYKEISQEVERLGREVAKAKAIGAAFDEASYIKAKDDLQTLSDEMTFASPTIWTMYKYEAYKDEAHPITSLQDFRVHCSKPGYICTNRFNFVNQSLEERGLPPLTNTAHYPDEMDLKAAYSTFEPLEADPNFMKWWKTYEYHRDTAGRVAKWENYEAK